MLARTAGACLGLFAFAVAISAGIIIQNPFNVTVTRSIIALAAFFFIGLALGAIADRVISEKGREFRENVQIRLGRASPSDSMAESEAKAPDRVQTPPTT